MNTSNQVSEEENRLNTIIKKALESPTKINRLEEFSESYENFGSLRVEDVSQLNFGSKFPNDLNGVFVQTASEIQRTMRPTEQINDAVRQKLEEQASLGNSLSPPSHILNVAE